MSFFHNTKLFLSIFLHCVQTASVASSPSPSAPSTNEMISFDVESFDVIDAITKVLNSLIEKTKCTLDVIGNSVGNGELNNIYKKFRADVDAIVNDDAKKCTLTKGTIEKIK